MTLNQQKKFEIKEDLKISFYVIIVIIVCFLIFMSILTYNIISDGVPGGTLMLGFIWSVSIVFLIFILFFTRGFTKIRSFIINEDEIKISVPNRPEFRILWSEIEKVQIKKHGFGKTLMIELIFTNKETSLSFRHKPGNDFRVRTNKKIISALENWCEIKGKSFSGYK
ncbi:MAG: hypothetical protein ACW96X_02175 [Promethearchaeota archaeon]|jgi:hypothetical protein